MSDAKAGGEDQKSTAVDNSGDASKGNTKGAVGNAKQAAEKKASPRKDLRRSAATKKETPAKPAQSKPAPAKPAPAATPKGKKAAPVSAPTTPKEVKKAPTPVKAEKEPVKAPKQQADAESKSGAEAEKEAEKNAETSTLILTADDKELEGDILLVKDDTELEEKLELEEAGEVEEKGGEDEEAAPEVGDDVKVEEEKVSDENPPENDEKQPADNDVAETPSEEKTSVQTKSSSSRRPTRLTRSFWVLNVSKSTKASDLKQHLSGYGEVTTAKIVTDGTNSYFGYVVMSSVKEAAACMKKLDGSLFENKKLRFSYDRPGKNKDSGRKGDAKGRNTDPKLKTRRSTADAKARERSRREAKRKSKSPGTGETKPADPNAPPASKSEERKDRVKPREVDWRREYLRERRESERLRARLLDANRRGRQETRVAREREERVRDRELKLDQDRKKFILEKELFEKKRQEMLRIDEEKRRIERERLELLRQRTKFEDDMRKSRFENAKKRRALDDDMESYSKLRKFQDYDGSYSGKRSGGFVKPHDILEDKADGRKIIKKSFDATPPPPPKIKGDYHEPDWDRKQQYIDRKPEGTFSRKVDAVPRKHFANDDYKHIKQEKKPGVFVSDRKHEYEKRYRDEKEPVFVDRDNSQRSQWGTPSGGYQDSWSSGIQSADNPRQVRYGDGNISSGSNFGGGPGRGVSFYNNHSRPDYPRYEPSGPQNFKKY